MGGLNFGSVIAAAAAAAAVVLLCLSVIFARPVALHTCRVLSVRKEAWIRTHHRCAE